VEMELRSRGLRQGGAHVIQQLSRKIPTRPSVRTYTSAPSDEERPRSRQRSYRTWSSGEVTEWRMPPVATTWSEFDPYAASVRFGRGRRRGTA